ncbi:MAG: DNA (cytosine-5-)-methyltransferase [Opitutae bacterium]|nr:DNA (cytosine-5-)-methyltransferase [Opitutae bacterium]
MRSIELFSGAGGLALGLEGAGFDTAALFERDADACATLRANRPQWNVVKGDVQNVDFSAYGPVAFVAGGPPCQPFSMGGKARGQQDHRDMFPEAVRAVRVLRPQAFMFENVRGLLRPAFRGYVEYIRLQLMHPEFPVSCNVDWETNFRRLERHHTQRERTGELTYRVTINLANAADYGVPQQRHRVFFVGFRHDVDAGWSFPRRTHTRDDLLRAKHVTGSYWWEHGIQQPRQLSASKQARKIQQLAEAELFSLGDRWRTVRDALAGLIEPTVDNVDSNHRLQLGARPYPGHTGSPIDEPAKALKAGDHGVPGGENMLRYVDGACRYFSIRESARLQTFPDDYRFFGSWTEAMRQLGNAVPVELARVVAASIRAKLQAHVPRPLQSTG